MGNGDFDIERMDDMEERLDELAFDLVHFIDLEPKNPDQWSDAKNLLAEKLHGACASFLDEVDETIGEDE